MHGGIGVTFEHDLHLFLRRVTVIVHWPGLRRTTSSGSPRLGRRTGRACGVSALAGGDGAEEIESLELPAAGPALHPGQPVARSLPEELRWERNEQRRRGRAGHLVARDREIQRMLFDAGLAGICFPRRLRGPGPDPRRTRGC